LAIDIPRARNPPQFAFVEFDDRRDAEDAIDGRDGYRFDGSRIRVEMSKGGGERRGERRGGSRERRGGSRDRGGYGRGRRDSRDRGGRGGGGGGGFGGRRTNFRVIVSNLPPTASWQDLKDFCRKGGDVLYTDVDSRKREGVVEFASKDDMYRAIDKLDDTEFSNAFDNAYVKLTVEGEEGEKKESRRSKSKSSSRSRSRSGSASSKGSRSGSRSASRDSSKDSRRSEESKKDEDEDDKEEEK